jgi:hypothetical protein
VLLVFGAPCQLRLLAGQEHGRTIPLAEVMRCPLLESLGGKAILEPGGELARFIRAHTTER